MESGQIDLALVPTEPSQFLPDAGTRLGELAARSFAPLTAPADVHIRHFFPPRFTQPREGQLVLIQPWEYGYLPENWVALIQENVREVWCYSRYVRDVYEASGIPPEMLHIVPLGVDAEVFRPDALPYVFTTEPGAHAIADGKPRFVFLFVGGTLHRKGIDILLDAYFQAFSATDDVCLVIKDTGTRTVYRGQNARDRVLGEVQDSARPPVIYLENDLPAAQMAGLYRVANCLVQPYRGEGFCLPALEAMACGCPVIVTEGGPTDDFVDESVGWRVAADRRPFGDGRIGPWDCVGPTWMFEVQPAALACQMRTLFEKGTQEALRLGQAAAARVQAGWTWGHSCQHILNRLTILRNQRSMAEGGRDALTSARPPSSLTAVTDTGSDPVGSSNSLAMNTKTGGALLSCDWNNVGRPRPRISLCMIVRDEERVMTDCLESVQRWVDEIVVVDTGSTDHTVEIAERFGACVFYFPWCDDFSAARNVSLAHATGDWILWMDADDTLPEECGRQLHSLIGQAEERTTGFLMQVHIPPGPGEAGFTIVDHVKLFRNLPGLQFEGRIHEQILEPIYRIGGRVERSDLYVVHSGYDYSPEGQRRKRARDLSLLELDLRDRPEHPFVLFNIGMTAFHMKDFTKAAAALERCLSLTKPRESIVRKVYAMLAGCQLALGDLAGARDRADQGLRLFPQDPELLFRAGIICREAGDLDAAERRYLTLLTAPESGHIDSLDVSMTGFKARHNLALIYQDMGRLEDAAAQWLVAVKLAPGFVPSWLALGELLMRCGRWAEAQAVAARLESLAPDEAAQMYARIATASSAPARVPITATEVGTS